MALPDTGLCENRKEQCTELGIGDLLPLQDLLNAAVAHVVTHLPSHANGPPNATTLYPGPCDGAHTNEK